MAAVCVCLYFYCFLMFETCVHRPLRHVLLLQVSALENLPHWSFLVPWTLQKVSEAKQNCCTVTLWLQYQINSLYLPLLCSLALYAVKVRAEAMQKASELVPSGMLSVIGRPQAQYKYACLQAKEYCKSVGIEEPVCSVANYLFPDGRVIAGHQQVWGLFCHGRNQLSA